MTALVHRMRKREADVWRQQRSSRISDILDENYYLSKVTEATPGKYDLENNPWWRDVIDTLGDPTTRVGVMLKGTQVGGSVTSIGAMLSLAVADPATGMVVVPSQDEARYVRDRVYENGLSSKLSFKRLVPPRRWWNMTAIQLGGSMINLAWAGSAQRLRGKPCKRVWLNECDVYEFSGAAGDPEVSALERVKQFFDYLIVYDSTPVGDNSRVFRKWEQSQKRFWNVECPHCGLSQPIKFFVYKNGFRAGCGGFGGIRESDGSLREAEDVRRDAHYICLNGCKIDQQYKNIMMQNGIWVPEGCRVDKETRQVVGAPKVSNGTVGWHIWSVFNSKISIGDIAAKYVWSVNNGKQRDFFQNDLGLRYRTAKKVADADTIGKKFRDEYQSGTVPAACSFLTCGIDVQGDRVYWLVVGWGPSRTPYIIDWGEFERDRNEVLIDDDGEEIEDSENVATGVIIASDLAMIGDLVMPRKFQVNGKNPRGRTELGIALAGPDTNHRASQVHDFVRVFNSPRLRCVKGDGTAKFTEPFKMTKVEKNTRTGKPYPGGLELWLIYKSFYQEQIDTRLVAAPNQPGVIHFPFDIETKGKKLLKQLTNVRKNEKGIYDKVNSDIGEDYRDCLAYAEALADMIVGDIGWDPQAWDAWNKSAVQRAKTAPKQSTESTILER